MDNLREERGDQGLIGLSHETVGWLKSAIVLLIIFQILLTCFNIAQSFDFPWQFAEGQYILAHGHPIKSVLNNYGEISPQFENEYVLYEALIAGVNNVFGWMGLCVFLSALCFLVYVPCLLAFLKAHNRFTSLDFCLLLLAEYFINPRLVARPELIANVCFILTGMMLMRSPALVWNGARTLAIGTIFFFWSNAHGTFLIGFAMMGLWYLQLAAFEWRALFFSGNFTWMRPGFAAFLGCAVNPFGLYRFIQPFQLHSLVWGQATSLEMRPTPGGVVFFASLWGFVVVLVLLARLSQRNYLWLIALMVLLEVMTLGSIRYVSFIGLTILLVCWDGLVHPRERFQPTVFPFAFAVSRLAIYLYVAFAGAWIVYCVGYNKVAQIRDYNRDIRPISTIITPSSFRWLMLHPDREYDLLSFMDAGSWAQMTGITGIHAIIDSGTHRYSDRTNQLYYYTLFSPETFRLVSSDLKINSILLGVKNIYWAPILNADPNWELVHVRTDSQLYLRRSGQSVGEGQKLFCKWEAIVEDDLRTSKLPPDPSDISFMRIIRGLGFRPDTESLHMLEKAPDVIWMEDPYITYVRDWINRVPDKTINDFSKDMQARKDDEPDKKDNRTALEIILLLRLRQDQQAAEIAHAWHPGYLQIGSQDMRLIQVEALLQAGDKVAATKMLNSIWPVPRFSLRWAQLCAQVYAGNPSAMPRNARLLMSLVDEPGWKNDMIAVLNGNIARLSARKTQ